MIFYLVFGLLGTCSCLGFGFVPSSSSSRRHSDLRTALQTAVIFPQLVPTVHRSAKVSACCVLLLSHGILDFAGCLGTAVGPRPGPCSRACFSSGQCSLLSQGHVIWKIVYEVYVILTTFDNAIQSELTRYKNNYKTLNLITTALGRNVYDSVAHLETAHDVWFKLCNTCEGSSEIKSSCRDTYNRQYQTFSHKSSESLDDCFEI
jgi:hypothetical protein